MSSRSAAVNAVVAWLLQTDPTRAQSEVGYIENALSTSLADLLQAVPAYDHTNLYICEMSISGTFMSDSKAVH